jgi:mono/diheme cytochrome c family protein
VTTDEIYLGLAALVLVVFSLVVSMVLPRWKPDFPGRNLRKFALVSVLLVLGMLAAVVVFGAEEGHGGGEGGEASQSVGQEIFEENQCAGCHTLAAADASGDVGPNLDEALKGKDAQFVEESIVNPDAFVEEGFSKDVMPENYGEDLSREELDALVAFLVESTRGS